MNGSAPLNKRIKHLNHIQDREAHIRIRISMVTMIKLFIIAMFMKIAFSIFVMIMFCSGVIIGWMVGLLSTMVPIFRGEHYEYKKGLSVCDVDMDTQENLNVSHYFWLTSSFHLLRVKMSISSHILILIVGINV